MLVFVWIKNYKQEGVCMDIVTGALIFILGTLVGSFLGVCITRLPLGKSVVLPPSSCPFCEKRIGAIDLVPVLSYLWLRGKCRNCKARISGLYPAVEALTGAVYLLLYLKFSLTPELPVYMVLSSLLIIAAFTDLRHMIIPNGVIIAGLVLGTIQLAATVITSLLEPWHIYVIGLFAGALPLLLISVLGWLLLKKEVIGGGDIKLMAFCGLVIGWKLVIPAYLIGITAGALFGIVLLTAGRKKSSDLIPLGAFLALGVLISVFFGYELIDWYLGY